MSVKPIPAGYHSITPYLIVDGGAAALDFYAKAFGAKEIMRFEHAGKISHAEIQIGDSRMMLGDEHPEMGALSPKTVGGVCSGLMLYVDDCDAMFHQAVAAGGTVERPLADQFYGDRSGTLLDPFGHKWTISTHKEDVTDEEIAKRMAAMGQS